MKDRLKQIRLKLGYNLIQMAETLQIEPNTYKGYEYKTKNLPCEFLIQLIKKLNVNINWLLIGEGEMFVKQPKTDENTQKELENIVINILKEKNIIKE